MGRRGRPSLNITPEERLQRRRSQLVASQRKRRAHKRLLSQPSTSTEQPCAATSERLLPAVPTASPVSDAMMPGHRAGVAVSLPQGDEATVTNTSANETRPNARSPPPAICHRCGSAPLDTAAIPAAVSPTSPASLLRTRQLGTDTHSLSSRLASPMPPSSTWAEHNANEPDAGTDKVSFTYIANHASLYDRGFDSSDCVGSNTLLSEELETSAAWLKRPAHTFTTGIDNVFFPGRATFTADSLWMPSPSLLEDDAPMLAGATLCGPILEACSPMLSDDGIEFWTPWTGAKQLHPRELIRRFVEACDIGVALLKYDGF
ncbi:hypothetical protein HDV64DRAFT_271105 [Trichoderma sp. TUCIM 5745]